MKFLRSCLSFHFTSFISIHLCNEVFVCISVECNKYINAEHTCEVCSQMALTGNISTFKSTKKVRALFVSMFTLAALFPNTHTIASLRSCFHHHILNQVKAQTCTLNALGRSTPKRTMLAVKLCQCFFSDRYFFLHFLAFISMQFFLHSHHAKVFFLTRTLKQVCFSLTMPR